ncbi:MAG TPA: hypothetical protein VGG46_11445 [Terriglobales bacterium]
MKTGKLLSRRLRRIQSDERDDYNVILTATLTLLGLIIGFSFSMAISRYDLRKNYEEVEANAIGTEYNRAELLGSPDAEKVRALLKEYLRKRLVFYKIRNVRQLKAVGRETAQLQNQMWTTVQANASAKPTPITALVVSGMNDVLDAQGYAQAAWWNRIPVAAWMLMLAIAICCTLLLGYGAQRPESLLLLTLPMVLSIAFLLIADIDSPRGGIIRVRPANLISLSDSLP